MSRAPAPGRRVAVGCHPWLGVTLSMSWKLYPWLRAPSLLLDSVLGLPEFPLLPLFEIPVSLGHLTDKIPHASQSGASGTAWTRGPSPREAEGDQGGPSGRGSPWGKLRMLAFRSGVGSGVWFSVG